MKDWLSGPKQKETRIENQSAKQSVILDNHRIVVLPFANISADAQHEYFADGMTEELISVLSNIDELNVISRTSAMKFKGAGKTVIEIGRELNAGTLLEGSVRKSDDRIRITAKLIDANSDKHLWSQTYDRKLEDVFSLQNEIAERVADSLKIKLVGGETSLIKDRQTGNLDAYNLYLQGRYQWNKRTQGSLKKALEYFEKAVELDSKYALAYSGIADAYLLLANYGKLSSLEASVKAKKYALKALEISRNLAEAHASLGYSLECEWNWKGAEEEFMKAIELNPNYSTAHQWYALLLQAMSRFDEALQQISLAERTDPLSLIVGSCAVNILMNAGKCDIALERANRLLELEPNFPPLHFGLAQVYDNMKMYDRAIQEAETAFRLEPSYGYRAMVMFYQVKAGRKSRKDLLALIDEFLETSKTEYVSPIILAMLYLRAEDDEQVFSCFEKAIAEHDPGVADIRFDFPEFQRYSNDPRYTNLLQKMGLKS